MPVSSQTNQCGYAAVIEGRPVGDVAVKEVVAELGSGADGAAEGDGVVERGGAVQAYPPIPAPAGQARTPGAQASPSLQPKETRGKTMKPEVDQ